MRNIIQSELIVSHQPFIYSLIINHEFLTFRYLFIQAVKPPRIPFSEVLDSHIAVDVLIIHYDLLDFIKLMCHQWQVSILINMLWNLINFTKRMRSAVFGQMPMADRYQLLVALLDAVFILAEDAMWILNLDTLLTWNLLVSFNILRHAFPGLFGSCFIFFCSDHF